MLAAEHQHVHGDACSPDVTEIGVPTAESRELVLLGRHEGGRAALVGQQLALREEEGEAKVSELDHSAMDHEVVRLDVAVANALGVQSSYSRHNLTHPLCRFVLLKALATLLHLVAKVSAVAIFEGQVYTG